MNYTINSNESIRTALNQKFELELSEFSQLDALIQEKTNLIQNSKDGYSALKEALSLSYVVLNYRATLISSLNSLRDSYSKFEETLKPALKRHEQNILNRLELIRDLHSSLELLQRLSYSNKIQ